MTVGIIIPAYNEETGIRKTIADIPRDCVDEIVVVDNGSNDDTANVAKEMGARVIYEPLMGYGQACLTGLSWYIENPVDIIVFLDADHADDPKLVPLLIEPIVNGNADMVIGCRVKELQEDGAMPPHAYFGNRLAVFMMKHLFNHTYTDLGPFRAIRFTSLVSIGMRDKNFGWTVEMQVKALQKNLKVAEISVPYRKRDGISKISGNLKASIKAGWTIISTILKLKFSR